MATPTGPAGPMPRTRCDHPANARRPLPGDPRDVVRTVCLRCGTLLVVPPSFMHEHRVAGPRETSRFA